MPALGFQKEVDPFEYSPVEEVLENLVEDGFMAKHGGKYRILERGKKVVMPELYRFTEEHRKLMRESARLFHFFPEPYSHVRQDFHKPGKAEDTHTPDDLLTSSFGRKWNLNMQIGYEAETDPRNNPEKAVENFLGNVRRGIPSIFQPYNQQDVEVLRRIFEDLDFETEVHVGLRGIKLWSLYESNPLTVVILPGLEGFEETSEEEETLEEAVKALEEGKSLSVSKQDASVHLYAYDPSTQKSEHLGKAGQRSIDLAEGRISLEAVKSSILGRGDTEDKFSYTYYRIKRRMELLSEIDSSFPVQRKLAELQGVPESAPLASTLWEPEDVFEGEKIPWYALAPTRRAEELYTRGKISLEEALEIVREGLGLSKI